MNLFQSEIAKKLQPHQTLSSHSVIALLMDGALERAEQAITAIQRDDREGAICASRRLTAIISSLQNCLDPEMGGDIADNLDALYDYMIIRLSGAGEAGNEAAFAEVHALLAQIKLGWNSVVLQSDT